MNNICEFYDNYSEDTRLLQRRSRQIEFITTVKYINEIVKENSIVADIGSGTGVYTLELAKRAAHVTAMDLVPSHIDKLNKKIEIQSINNISTFVGSALDIKVIESSSIDYLLCLGPYYHLQNEKDRLLCFSECNRVLKAEGIAFFGYINRVNAMQYYVKNKKYFSKDINTKLNMTNYENIQGFDKFLDISFLSDPEMIENEASRKGFCTLNNIGVDSVSYFIQDQLEEMTENEWNDYLEFHFENCERKNSFGMSMHGLLICQKD